VQSPWTGAWAASAAQRAQMQARPRAAGHAAPSGALNAAGAAADCVFKRMPSIGDTAAHAVSARW